jgi:hypothetical protein
MIPDYEIKQGTTTPPLKVNLTGRDGLPADLKGATVKFILNDFRGELKFNGTCVITNLKTAEVEYQWQIADTEEAAQYEGMFVIDYGSGVVSKFPSHRNLIIDVTRGLDEV